MLGSNSEKLLVRVTEVTEYRLATANHFAGTGR
jgi:hypothetical protein